MYIIYHPTRACSIATGMLVIIQTFRLPPAQTPRGVYMYPGMHFIIAESASVIADRRTIRSYLLMLPIHTKDVVQNAHHATRGAAAVTRRLLFSHHRLQQQREWYYRRCRAISLR